VFVIVLYYGNTKPSSVKEYLEDFLQELARLKRDGVTFESNKLSLNVHCFFI
jgi:ribosomal protein L10